MQKSIGIFILFIFEGKCERGFYGQLCENNIYKTSRFLNKTEVEAAVVIQNPCLNDGVQTNQKCMCKQNFTGELCESRLCLEEHSQIANHTMCLPDSPRLVSGGVNESTKVLITNTHNEIRRNVSPQAANMQTMYWDAKLQLLAQKRAQLCSVDKINILARQEPTYGTLTSPFSNLTNRVVRTIFKF